MRLFIDETAVEIFFLFSLSDFIHLPDHWYLLWCLKLIIIIFLSLKGILSYTLIYELIIRLVHVYLNFLIHRNYLLARLLFWLSYFSRIEGFSMKILTTQLFSCLNHVGRIRVPSHDLNLFLDLRMLVVCSVNICTKIEFYRVNNLLKPYRFTFRSMEHHNSNITIYNLS